MTPSTACASVIVDELVRCGVREVVLSPGSRSAPIAYAVQQAERAGRLRLHVRVDERSGAFLALGLARMSGVPAVVVTTSGTAVANLHPAVLEAHHGEVPLIVLSADRPAELRGAGANQTTLQPGIFGGAVRWSADLPAAEHRGGQNAWWRSTVGRAWSASRGDLGSAPPGPVHLNVGFRDPLAPGPDDEAGWPESLDGRNDGQPWVQVAPAPGMPPAPGAVEDVERTLVVVGDLPGPTAAADAVRWARLRGYPVVAEPFGSFGRGAVLPHGPLLLTATEWVDAHAPARVVVVGRPTLSRAVAALLRRPGIRVEAVTGGATWADPAHAASLVHPWSAVAGDLTAAGESPPERSRWAAAWDDAGARVADAVAEHGFPWPSGLAVAAMVGAALPGDAVLFVGSSNPVRDLDLAMGRPGPDAHAGVEILANRGLAGIDGCVSTAVGVALTAGGPAYALLGDLTLLHDGNGLMIGPDEPHPDLTVVVPNDGGGGIFATLEHGAPERAGDVERIFATPTGTDLEALCRAHGVRHLRADTPEALAAAVRARPQGLTVVEVRVDRASHRSGHAALAALAANVLGGGSSARSVLARPGAVPPGAA